MKNRMVGAAVLACALTSGRALAEPYEFVAYYQLQQAGQPTREQAIVIAEGMTLVDHGSAFGAEPARKLKRISVRLKSDSISRSALATMRNISFQLRDVARPCAPGAAPDAPNACPAPLVNIQSGSDVVEKTLIQSNTLSSRKAIVELDVDARLHYDADFLCKIEQELRTSRGRPAGKMGDVLPFVTDIDRAPGGAAPPGGGAKNVGRPAVAATSDDKPPKGLYALSMLASRGLPASDGTPLAYSFCKDVVDHVDFGKVPKQPGEDAKDVRARHKRELSTLIIDELKSQSKITAKIVSDNGRENIVVEDKFSFSIARSVDGLFSFREKSWNQVNEHGSQDGALPHIVDQDSTIILAARGWGCTLPDIDCDTIVRDHLVAQIEGKDKAGNPFKKEVALVSKGGDRWELKASLRDFYGQTLTFVLVYKLGDERFRLLENTVDVENLGFVTSFPLVSEVVSLASKAESNEVNPKDTEWQSSIPLSWAFNLTKKDGRSLAVTLPWMMSVNSRALDPRFSDKVKFFPHMSAVLPVSAGDQSDDYQAKPELVFGAGLAFVNTFTLSWGIGTRAADNYALIGISLPDLVRALKLTPTGLVPRRGHAASGRCAHVPGAPRRALEAGRSSISLCSPRPALLNALPRRAGAS